MAVTMEQIKQDAARQAEEIRKADRQRLAELEKETRRMGVLTQCLRFRLSDGRTLVNSTANVNLLNELLGEGFTYSLFLDFISQDKYREMLSWQSPPPTISREEQTEADRRTFAEAAKQFKFSQIDANLNLILSMIGSGFSVGDVGDQLPQLGLVAATPAELTNWDYEDKLARQKFLINEATPQQLRHAARQEMEQSRQMAQQQHADHQHNYVQQQQAGMFPQVPEFTATGERIDNSYLMKLSNQNYDQFKQMVKKYGVANMNARIRGLS